MAAFGGSDVSPYGWQMAMTVYAVIAIAALWFYDLDRATVKQMCSELAERRAREAQGTLAA